MSKKRNFDQVEHAPKNGSEAKTRLTSKSKDATLGIETNMPDLKPYTSFHHLDSNLQQLVQGFTIPTIIQQHAMAAISFTDPSGHTKDVIGISETGSGKTLAFGLPILAKIVSPSPSSDEEKKAYPQLLILAPTRELALQTNRVLSKVVSSVCIYGGASKQEQRQELKTRRPLVIVGTPGRIIDFLSESENGGKSSLRLDKIKYFVLDEADRMLDMGFSIDIEKIASKLPKQRQTVMFSATWPLSIQSLASKHLRADPIKIVVKKPTSIIGDEHDSNTGAIGTNTATHQVSSTITQHVQVIQNYQEKDANLLDLLKRIRRNKQDRIIVFALYKKEAARLELFLRRNGHLVCALHGDMAQAERTRMLEEFKSGRVPLLVATDVAARGLDIPDVEAVVNYTFPLTIEDYVHRIGRTGRAGKAGQAYTFFTDLDKAHSGELINLLKGSGVVPPAELLAYGCTTKKKQHKDYGAFYKEIDPLVKSTHVKFDEE